MSVDAYGTVQQRTPSIVSEGVVAGHRLSSKRQLFTAGWREELFLSGACFRTVVGGISAGGAESLVQGGGNGTTIDSDQPELIVSVPAGYYMIPLEFHAAGRADLDANAETAQIILFADLTQAVAASGVTGTAITTVACLDSGNHSSRAHGWHTVTADVTDPVASAVLAFKTVAASEFVSNGTATNLTNGITVKIDCEYNPAVPLLCKGPCSIVACWGGSAAVNAIASLTWAELPLSALE